MPRFHSLLLACTMTIGTLFLLGCESGPSLADEAQPRALTEIPAGEPAQAPDITTRMRLFDVNIGDTATATGGGGAEDPR